MTGTNANNIILSKTVDGTNKTVTIAVSGDEENWTKKINLIPSATSTKDRSYSVGKKDTKVVDVGLNAERRITIDGYVTTGIGGATNRITDDPLSSGAGTINVESTSSFPSTGNLIIGGDTGITYSGKTSTSFTGVSGISNNHSNNEFVMGNNDTSNTADGKKDDLYQIFFVGGTIMMTYEGSNIEISIDKFSIKRVLTDGVAAPDGVGEFSVKFTCVAAVDF